MRTKTANRWACLMSSKAEELRSRKMEEAYDLVGSFLSFLSDVRRLSPHTVRAYESDLNAFLAWCKREGVAPLEATRLNMRSYLASLNRAAYAEKTINRRVSSLRTFYAWVEREGVGNASAVSTLKGRKLSKVLPKTMTDADLVRLMDTCNMGSDEGVRDRALLELLYATGARISEAAGLCPDDVDFAQGQVSLFGKRSKERIVPLHKTALDVLKGYVENTRPRLVAARRSQDYARALFVSTRGNDMSADTLRRVFKKHMQMAGLDPSLTPHAVRHSFATELLDGGADLKAVQELLGHESLATTQIYTHLSIDRLKAATRLAHPRG